MRLRAAMMPRTIKGELFRWGLRLRRMLLRLSCRALSRSEYHELSALEPGLGLARHLWRSKELRARPLHDLPPMVGLWRADGDQILPLIRPSHGMLDRHAKTLHSGPLV